MSVPCCVHRLSADEVLLAEGYRYRNATTRRGYSRRAAVPAALRSRLSMTSPVNGCALCACWTIFRADPLVPPIPDRPPVELPRRTPFPVAGRFHHAQAQGLASFVTATRRAGVHGQADTSGGGQHERHDADDGQPRRSFHDEPGHDQGQSEHQKGAEDVHGGVTTTGLDPVCA